MPCTAGYVIVKKGRKPKTLGGFFVCVCVMSLAALRVRFPVCSGGLVYETHEADILGRS